MKLFIPTINTELVLSKPWTFTLYQEYRNNTLWKYFDCPNGEKSCEITIPEKDKLEVIRIYIRQRASEFDSVSFGYNPVNLTKRIKKNPFGPSLRFWAKLEDVNNIEYEETLSVKDTYFNVLINKLKKKINQTVRIHPKTTDWHYYYDLKMQQKIYDLPLIGIIKSVHLSEDNKPILTIKMQVPLVRESVTVPADSIMIGPLRSFKMKSIYKKYLKSIES